MPYLGETLRLVPEPGRARVHRRGDELLVPAGDPREALERWYRRQARAEIAPRLDAATARAGTTYTGLTIRAQKTRWASCSSTGAMSFNWRLLLAPPEILDYVVEHEVAHIEVMDHSPRFWRLLASRSPGWRAHSAWLRRYGSTLDALSIALDLFGACGAARATLSPGCGSIAARRIRPVQATIEPSPRTSTPARTPAPLSSIRAATRSPGS